MTIKQIAYLAMVGMAVMAWVQWAEHPTARNLRRALTDTMTL